MYGINNGVCLTDPMRALIGSYKVTRTLTTRENVHEKIKKFREVIIESIKVYPEEYVFLSVLNPIINEMIIIYSRDESSFDSEYYKKFYTSLMEGFNFLEWEFMFNFIKLSTCSRYGEIQVNPDLVHDIYQRCIKNFETEFTYTKINALVYTFECITRFGVSNLNDSMLLQIDKIIDFLESQEDLISKVVQDQLDNNNVKKPRFLAY